MDRGYYVGGIKLMLVPSPAGKTSVVSLLRGHRVSIHGRKAFRFGFGLGYCATRW